MIHRLNKTNNKQGFYKGLIRILRRFDKGFTKIFKISKAGVLYYFMIGERLRELRKKKGLKQKDLAEILDIDKTKISAYEINKNNPPDDIKVLLAQYFNVSLDYLLGVINTQVGYYKETAFLKLPEGISDDERELINDFAGFICSRNTKNEKKSNN